MSPSRGCGRGRPGSFPTRLNDTLNYEDWKFERHAPLLPAFSWRLAFVVTRKSISAIGTFLTLFAILNEEFKMIVKVKGGYRVLSSKGKNLGGPYKTLDEAKKRLHQVEFFKRRKG